MCRCVGASPLRSTRQGVKKRLQQPTNKPRAKWEWQPAPRIRRSRTRQARPITAGGFVDGAPVVFRRYHQTSGTGQISSSFGHPSKRNRPRNHGLRRRAARLRQRWLAGYLSREWLHVRRDERARSRPRARCCCTTITTARSLMSPKKPAWPTNAGDSAWPSPITTTMAGRTSTLPTYGKNRLYHNNHDGTFTDVAEKAGVALGGWSTGPNLGRLRP